MMLRLAHDHTYPFENSVLTIPLTRKLTSLAAQLIFFLTDRTSLDRGNEDDAGKNNENTSFVSTLTLYTLLNGLSCPQTRSGRP